MRKRTLFFFVFGLIVVGALVSGCRKDGPAKAAADKRLETGEAGDLAILAATPQGVISSRREADTVVIMFDRPIVSLEALPEGKGQSVLRFDPPVSGKTRWLGSRILTFIPEDRFPSATTIKALVPAGMEALDGSTLKKDYSWTFQTAAPQLVQHYPQDKQKGLRLDTEVLLVFNQEMDRKSAKDFLSLVAVDGKGTEKRLEFRLSRPSPERLKEEDLDVIPETALLLKPREPLSPGFTYLVGTRPGLPSAEGTIRSEKGAVFSFETFREFRFDGLAETRDLRPSEPLQFKFSNEVMYKSFARQVRFDPPVQIPGYYGDWDYSNDVLYLSVPLSPETRYVATIGPELEDDFGNSLDREVRVEFTTASFPPSASMTTGFGILEASGGARYPLSVMNVEHVFLQAARLGKNEVIPLLLQPRIFWSDQKFPARPGFFKLEKKMPVSAPRNESRVVPIDISAELAGQYGFVFLQVDTLLPEAKWNRYQKAFLQVTDLGISGKFSPDNTVIWVTELRSGLPVPEADVEIRNDLNQVKWKGRTDREGMVQSPGWKELGLTSPNDWEEPQQWVFASRGKDTAVSSSAWGTGIDPYRFRIAYDWNPQPPPIQGSIFTERGIYRAGEEVHIKGIVRIKERGDWVLPSAKTVECEILDPFQKTVFKGTAAVDSFGSFALDFGSAAEASLGQYEIQATIAPERAGEKPFPLSGSFRVEAFRPAEFEVHLRAEKESGVFGREYAAEVRASYLFGGPMAGQPVTWYLRLNQTRFSPPGYRGYVFGNELEWGDEESSGSSRLAASGEAVLDSKGMFKIRQQMRSDKEKDSASATLEATVVSPSRRSVTNRIQTIIHRGEYYLGLRPATTFLKKGETQIVDVVAAYPDGRLSEGRKIVVKLFKREWRSVRQAGIGGRFRWLTEKEDNEISAREIRTGTEPVRVTFLPEQSGFYFLLAAGADTVGNQISTATYFYVTGSDYVPWERRDDDSTELVADAASYQPGQTASILVKSPYERAKALVTVEREFILESRILDIESTTSQIEVPIGTEHIPNAFVSVLLIQGRKSDRGAAAGPDLSRPSFKIGYVNLHVDPRGKRLNVEILKDKEEYRPGEKVSLTFNVRDREGAGCSASMTVAVVDVGVLNLIGYRTPDPFSEFYGERPLAVRTSETRIHVVGQREYGEKGEDVGGGGEGQAAILKGGLAEVELRGDFRTTAYWNPALSTDESGQAEVTFQLPDNLTTFRVMAVAQTKDSRFGGAETTFRVSKSLLLQASLPRFARVGDAFEGGVLVHNFSPREGSVILKASASGIRMADPIAERQFRLQPGESREILYAFRAEQPGRAAFQFRAVMNEENDGLEAEIPLLLPRATETVAFFGETAGAAVEGITIPDDVFLEHSRIDVQAASSALLGLTGSIDDLRDFPYLCLEQRLSVLLPYIIAPRLAVDFGLTRMSPEDVRETVLQGLGEISAYQRDSGGFGLWPDSRREAPFLTGYAVLAMIKAAEKGYAVDPDRLNRGLTYLDGFLREKWNQGESPFSRGDWATTKALCLYVLALADRPQPAFAEKMFTEREDLSLFGKALLLKAMYYGKGIQAAQATVRQELLNAIKVTPESAHFEEDADRDSRWTYSTNIRTTASVLQTLIEIGSDHPSVPAVARWLVAQLRSGRRLSTQDNFYVLYALNDYYQAVEGPGADFHGRITLAGKSVLEGSFSAEGSEFKRAEVRLSELGLPQGMRVLFQAEKEGDGLFYYGARMTYAPRGVLPARDEGIAVLKRIESLDGKPLEGIPSGALVVVTLEVAVPRESLFVVVDDPLPAGLEAVNPHFLTESVESQKILEAAEHSRTSPWWQGFNHFEMHDDRVVLFADSLPAGVHIHRYLARALSLGEFVLPGTFAGEMYAPEVFGRSPEKTIRVNRTR